jgi:hypothetical protein
MAIWSHEAQLFSLFLFVSFHSVRLLWVIFGDLETARDIHTEIGLSFLFDEGYELYRVNEQWKYGARKWIPQINKNNRYNI